MLNRFKIFLLFIIILFLMFTGCRIEQPEAKEATAVSTSEESNQEETTVAEVTAVPTTIPDPTATTPPQPTEPPPPTYTPIFEEASCQFEPIGDFEAQCGYLIVPEDRTQPDGNQIRLHVAIFPTLSDNPSPDPVIYLDGGPGGDALERIDFFFEDDFAPFLEERDFIMFDQRGTGFSEPGLACEEVSELTLETLDDDVTDEENTELTLTALEACRQRLMAEGINLAAYNSVENAADLNDLRIALGIDEWNLFGISYGTRLALVSMRNHPDGIRSVILDSAFPPQVNLTEEMPVNTSRAFNVLFENCQLSDECNAAYPDLESRFFALVDGLEAEPITIQVTDFFKGDQYDALVDGDSFFSVIFQGLYSEEIIPLLPQLIADTEAGNYTLLGLLISNDITTLDFFSIGMYFSVLCREEIAFEEVADVETAVATVPEYAQFFEDTDANFEICALWNNGIGESVETLPVNSDIPTLIMAGEFDPITPPVWGEITAQTLPNSFYYLYSQAGHAVSTSGECPRQMVMDFLNEPTVAPDATCIAETAGVPPQFQTRGTAVQTEHNLIEFEADSGFGAIIGVRPESWEEQFAGVYARANNALDQTAILQIGAPGIPADTFLGLITEQLGVEGELEELDQVVDSNGRTWEQLSGELQGLSLQLAVTSEDDFSFVVVLIAEEADIEALTEAVFLPALDAIRVKN